MVKDNTYRKIPQDKAIIFKAEITRVLDSVVNKFVPSENASFEKTKVTDSSLDWIL